MIRIKHFENGLKEFKTSEEFIDFVKIIFKENEDYKNMECPETEAECKYYIKLFCDNFEMVSNYKVAKLVTFSVTTRVVVNSDSNEAYVSEHAKQRAVGILMSDGSFDYLESIEDDIECPYGKFEGEI